jgi:hypothetical protein
MTANRNLKRRVRTRAAKTGESYAAALRLVRPTEQGDAMPEVNLVKLATAQLAAIARLAGEYGLWTVLGPCTR